MNMKVDMNLSPMAELSRCAAEAAWFCVRTHLKHEHIAAAHLRLLPDVEVFSPRMRLLRSTRRGRVWSTESLFPNYLFARFNLEARLEKVRCSPSVRAVVRFGNWTPVIPDLVIEALRLDLAGMESRVLVEAPEEGEEVEVAGGAFTGLKGPVMRVLPAKQRVQILLEVMGRPIPAELSLGQVLFKKKEVASLVLDGARAHCLPCPNLAALVRGTSELPGPALIPERQAIAA